MLIRAGYDIAFEVPQPTPLILMLTVHPSRAKDLVTEHRVRVSPSVPARDYRDVFGNICTRVVAPVGAIEFRANFDIRDSGRPDDVLLSVRPKTS
jgi:hypothetical protein